MDASPIRKRWPVSAFRRRTICGVDIGGTSTCETGPGPTQPARESPVKAGRGSRGQRPLPVPPWSRPTGCPDSERSSRPVDGSATCSPDRPYPSRPPGFCRIGARSIRSDSVPGCSSRSHWVRSRQRFRIRRSPGTGRSAWGHRFRTGGDSGRLRLRQRSRQIVQVHAAGGIVDGRVHVGEWNPGLSSGLAAILVFGGITPGIP